MARKARKDQSPDPRVGQHVAFPVAVQLASSHLLEDARALKGSAVLNVVGNALARVVPLYFRGAGVAKPRALSETELEGSQVMQRARVLLLKDGRRLSAVSIKRRDLERGIAVLKTIGIPELGSSSIRYRELAAQLAEIEQLVNPPLLPSQLDRVNSLAVSIARGAAGGSIGELAMRLLGAAHDARSAGERADNRAIKLAIARLRDAIGNKV